MDNGLKYRDLLLLVDDKIYELADQIYDEQNDKNYAEITEDQVIELVKNKFENDQILEDNLMLGCEIMLPLGRTEDIEQVRDHFYYTAALKILNALERRNTGVRTTIYEFCSPTRHPRSYNAMYES